ncbi:hypothetical protein AVEN_127384-1 [Araneus ventricosus]|uniref:Uncharacterized protein n=1 Tax=Araneus ventricosus TaxID=182803 RepID=A0A4Y2EVL2_ARAVE|nr:hypothetical protein AVEN_127384-1 [Araneus ventricosus]
MWDSVQLNKMPTEELPLRVDQTDENRLGPSLDCKVDAVALANQTFHLFGLLKQHIGGKHFADDDDVQHDVLL